MWPGDALIPAGASTAAVERRAFAATIAAIGTVKPQIGAEVRVGSRVSGRVRRLRANVGDRVTKGEVIAELETDDLNAVLAQRDAERRLAAAKLESIARMGPGEIARAEADVAQFEAASRLAAAEWERIQALLRDRAASQADADVARERSAAAQAQLEAARRTLTLRRTGADDQRQQAEAERDRAEAAYRSAQVDRAFAIIAAPISGVVSSVATQEGETVAAGLSAPTFLTIIDLDRLLVHAYVDEVDIGRVVVGQAASFTVDAFPARDFTGRVDAIYPSATLQDNVVKYVVAVALAGSDHAVLRPEMTANVRITLDSRTVLAIPARAVRRDGAATIVWVARRGDPERRTVRVGWRDGPWVEVVDGLQEGERVLVDYTPTGAAP